MNRSGGMKLNSFQPVFFSKKNHNAALPARMKSMPAESEIKGWCIKSSYKDAVRPEVNLVTLRYGVNIKAGLMMIEKGVSEVYVGE